MKYVIAFFALAGLIVSALSLRIHYMDPNAAPPCAVSEHWDCGAVSHSRFSVLPPRAFDEDPASTKIHIPVATLGIIGYALMAGLALMGRFWIVLQLAEIGFAFACFLTYLEAYVLQKWCIYCLWSQGLVTALLLATVVGLVLRRRAFHVLEMPAVREVREI